jgi:hypothetical protein
LNGLRGPCYKRPVDAHEGKAPPFRRTSHE